MTVNVFCILGFYLIAYLLVGLT